MGGDNVGWVPGRELTFDRVELLPAQAQPVAPKDTTALGRLCQSYVAVGSRWWLKRRRKDERYAEVVAKVGANVDKSKVLHALMILVTPCSG